MNVEWVACDSCDEWFHTMCGMLTMLEEISVTANDTYECLQCTGGEAEVEKAEVFADKITSLLDKEEKLNACMIAHKVSCDDFQAQYHSIVGFREKALSDALESIKVKQAYYGNVLVGNHCITVLNKYKELTSVIEDPSKRDIFNVMLCLFSKIMKVVMARRFLTPTE